MVKVSKFLENELDRINNYLSMAEANLQVISELCENNCQTITSRLSKSEMSVIDNLNKQVSKLDIKITSAKEIIKDFKDYYSEAVAEVMSD